MRWFRVLLVAVIVVGIPLGGFTWLVRRRTDLVAQARAELDAKDYRAALSRLEPLEGVRSWWDPAPPGEVDYLIGLARWQIGRRKEALAAFARIPPSSPRAVAASGYLAEGLIEQGHWRNAESVLERAASRNDAPADLYTVRKALDRLYRMQARFADAARVSRAAWPDEPDPVAALRSLWRTERGTPPYGTITQALDTAAQLDPSDDRVWLGRARVALGAGRLDECAEWLSKCGIPPARPDEAVWKTWLDYAAAAGQAEQAVRALQSLRREVLGDVEWLGWRAWFAERTDDPEAEAAAINLLLTLEPRDPRWLTRGAALAAESGDTATATARRNRKTEVDQALDAYTQAMSGDKPVSTAAERIALGKLAAQAGRPFDARAWFTLALKLEPENAEARAALESAPPAEPRLTDAQRPKTPDPWDPSEAASSGVLLASSSTTITMPQFSDVASPAGLRHVFENGETPIRQMPVALSGGVGLIDYDGDGWLDVYCVQGGPFPPPEPAASGGRSDRLFRNRGDGSFEDVSESTGIARLVHGYGQGLAVGDLDNDGRSDLILTRWRGYQVLRNTGQGFEDVTKAWGLEGDRDWPTSAALADLDNDGDLDLYVCHYVVWNEPRPAALSQCGDEFLHVVQSHVVQRAARSRVSQ
ncbi:MAG: FG-GAP-like repeat-containing protein [Isosphaeraceae bacterium]